MPGGGIDETNAAQIITATKATELHLTGRMDIDSEMIFRRHGISLGGQTGMPEFTRKVADPERIKKIIESVKMI
jgi:copper homeostasis protein